jgi:hypothetical protein
VSTIDYGTMTVDQLKENATPIFSELPTTTEQRMTSLFDKVIKFAQRGPSAAGVNDVTVLERDIETELRNLPDYQEKKVRPLVEAGLDQARAWNEGAGAH